MLFRGLPLTTLILWMNELRVLPVPYARARTTCAWHIRTHECAWRSTERTHALTQLELFRGLPLKDLELRHALMSAYMRKRTHTRTHL